MTGKLPDTCLNQLFREARTHNAWLDKAVPDELLRAIVDLLKLGPTSANCSPARFLFVKSRAAKERVLFQRSPRFAFDEMARII